MSLALLVTGAGGQLSTDLLEAVRSGKDMFARGLTIEDLDITDAFAVQDMVLGWEPQFSNFDAGIEDTIAWYRDNEDWWRPQKAATEAKYKVQGQ